jgi:ABC-2 type transport system permease protein
MMGPPLPTQYVLLFRMQFAKIRREWYYYFVIPILVALGLIWMRWLLAEGDLTDAAAERFVAGAMVVAAMFGTINAVAHETALSRSTGEIEYLSTFPLSRLAFVVAMVTLPILYTIPSILTILVAGSIAFDLTPNVQPMLPVILLASALMLAGIGIALGLYVPVRAARTLAGVLPIALMLFTPVLAPGAEFPAWLRDIGNVLPTTRAVEAVEAALFGSLGGLELVDFGVVCAVSAVELALVIRLPGWRNEA